MKKRFGSLVLALFLVVMLPVSGVAAGLDDYDYGRFTPSQKIYSTGGFLPDEAIAELEATAAALDSEYGVTVAFVITDDFSGDAEEFSDAIFLRSPLGEAYRQDFVLLQIDMAGRVVDLYTHGSGQRAVSDAEVNYILDEIAVANLQNEDYEKACADYLYRMDQLLDAYFYPTSAAAQQPVGGETSYVEEVDYSTPILIALAVSAVMTGIFLAYQFAQHRPVAKAANAREYVADGSFVLSKNSDIFIRTHTRKTQRPKSNSSSGGGGSSHRHSSGRSHGGGSRRF